MAVKSFNNENFLVFKGCDISFSNVHAKAFMKEQRSFLLGSCKCDPERLLLEILWNASCLDRSYDGSNIMRIQSLGLNGMDIRGDTAFRQQV